ncbi:MAG: ferrous iron transporter B [Deltaproteobacteria bacterium]|nr:ferrous iron transporter B [Deltaproteobacteria bacterium]
MADARPGDVLILGNLQAGKTTVFRRLCGERAQEVVIPKTSSRLAWARVRPRTIGRIRSLLGGFVAARRSESTSSGIDGMALLDCPGTATLFPQSEEELVARDTLLGMRPTAILVVADAKNMRRSLTLIAHAAEFQLPMVVALNMVDEAQRHGITVDAGLLSSQLGVDVIPTVAHQGQGLDRLVESLAQARVPHRIARFTDRIERWIESIEELLADLPCCSRGVAEMVLVGDLEAEQLVRDALGIEILDRAHELVSGFAVEQHVPLEVILTEALHAGATRLSGQAVTRTSVRRWYLDAVGRYAHHPVFGLVIAAFVVTAMYFWVGELGATRVVDGLNTYVFEGWLIPLCDRLVAHIPWPIVRDAIMDPDFGLLPTGVFLAFGLVMPVLFFFYCGFTLLVESGYLPRLSILLDRALRVIGLNGRGILPLTMGLSCVTMALITTRMLETQKERNIASFLLILGLPCAPMLAVMLVILADLPIAATIVVFAVIAFQTLVAGFLAAKVHPGLVSDFIIEVPPMRIPKLRSVLRHSVRQTYHFMKEAVPLFMLASLVLFTVDRLGGLAAAERVTEPLVGGLLGLPEDSVQVFIKTMIRRESGAAELNLTMGGFDNVQLVVTLLVMTFLTPCINSFFVLIKERGLRNAIVLVLLASVNALLVGAAVNGICRGLGVTFT